MFVCLGRRVWDRGRQCCWFKDLCVLGISKVQSWWLNVTSARNFLLEWILEKIRSFDLYSFRTCTSLRTCEAINNEDFFKTWLDFHQTNLDPDCNTSQPRNLNHINIKSIIYGSLNLFWCLCDCTPKDLLRETQWRAFLSVRSLKLILRRRKMIIEAPQNWCFATLLRIEKILRNYISS